MSTYGIDEVITFDESKAAHAVQSMFRSFEAAEKDWTPRDLGMRMALGGLHPIVVGSVEQVADHFEQWVTEADCDGFNIASVTNPSSWQDVVDLLCPEDYAAEILVPNFTWSMAYNAAGNECNLLSVHSKGYMGHTCPQKGTLWHVGGGFEP